MIILFSNDNIFEIYSTSSFPTPLCPKQRHALAEEWKGANMNIKHPCLKSVLEIKFHSGKLNVLDTQLTWGTLTCMRLIVTLAQKSIAHNFFIGD